MQDLKIEQAFYDFRASLDTQQELCGALEDAVTDALNGLIGRRPAVDIEAGEARPLTDAEMADLLASRGYIVIAPWAVKLWRFVGGRSWTGGAR
jgi:hypothetical protein